jgi:formiminoglutamase
MKNTVKPSLTDSRQPSTQKFKKTGNAGATLILIPDDQGVLNVGGRIGASQGPQAFELAWSRFSPQSKPRQFIDTITTVHPLSHDLEHNHTLASQVVTLHHATSEITVIIGGGHDHGYSHLRGIKNTLAKNKKLGCINLDAHLDLRQPQPKITSGSPFYLALENKILLGQHLIEFGIQSHCNSPELFNYAERQRVSIVHWKNLRHKNKPLEFKKALQKLERTCDEIVLSIDCDAMAQSEAPGVSAPQAEGFTAQDLIHICELAGQSKKIKSLGIFELNPLHDSDQKTARLAATAAYHFIESKIEKFYDQKR